MEIEQPINDKVKEYCHYCVCKSCEDVQRLQAENAKLNAIIDGYQPKLQALKDEKDKYYQQTLDDEIQINELYQTLQEIKTIAETELSYDMSDNEYRHYRNYDIIRHLITKAEVNNE